MVDYPFTLAPWYTKEGPDQDVVVSSKIRLSRNLADLPFPGTMDDKTAETASERIVSAMSALVGTKKLKVLRLDSLKTLTRKALADRELASLNYALEPFNWIVASEDEALSSTINELDHIRLNVRERGLCLNHAYAKAESIEMELAGSLEFAFSPEAGYLTTEFSNLGTGLNASILMHLPALVETGFLERALKAVMGLGLSVQGFFGGEGQSLGSYYLLSSTVSIGVAEQEILVLVDKTARQLAEFERRAREEMIKKRSLFSEDFVWRAWGLLTNCRLLSYEEAAEMLSKVRFGLCMGLLPKISLEEIDALLLDTKKACIELGMGLEGEVADNKAIDAARAKIVRDCLIRT